MVTFNTASYMEPVCITEVTWSGYIPELKISSDLQLSDQQRKYLKDVNEYFAELSLTDPIHLENIAGWIHGKRLKLPR